MTFQPLNPSLYNLLRLHFGEVDVVAAGQAIDWYVARELGTSRTGEKKNYFKRKVRSSGEEYKVNCPYCNDQRKRLYINHRWGVWDEATHNQNLFLAQCFNEQCIDDWRRQQQLWERVTSPADAGKRRGEMGVGDGVAGPKEVCEVSPPGVLIRLDELKRRHPHHEALVYLQNRGFDTDFLAERYDVSFCPHSKFSLATNRVIIPLYKDGKLVNWQARYVGDNVNGKPFNVARVPKFWTCPNSARRLLAYNIDTAVLHDTILIVEGSTDVWRAGPQSFGLWGKKMNPELTRRFLAMLRRQHPEEYPLVCIVLDPEQDEKEKAKGKPHHIEALLSQLKGALGHRVFPLYLPPGMDPGGLERKILREFVRREAAKHGLKATFTKPKGTAA